MSEALIMGRWAVHHPREAFGKALVSVPAHDGVCPIHVSAAARDAISCNGEALKNTRMRRPVSAFLAIVAMAVTAILFAGSPASAAPVTYRISNRGTGACLSGNPNNSVYTVYPCTNISYHDWIFGSFVNSGNMLIKNSGTPRCISANYNDDVYLVTPCTDIDFHGWRWTAYGELMNIGTGRCLSANFANDVYTAQCVGDDVIYHLWRTDL